MNGRERRRRRGTACGNGLAYLKFQITATWSHLVGKYPSVDRFQTPLPRRVRELISPSLLTSSCRVNHPPLIKGTYDTKAKGESRKATRSEGDDLEEIATRALMRHGAGEAKEPNTTKEADIGDVIAGGLYLVTAL
jgi:hypothetical protein